MKAVLLGDCYLLNTQVVLLVDKNITEDEIIKSIKKARKETKEWKLDDIIKYISIPFQKIEFKEIYI